MHFVVLYKNQISRKKGNKKCVKLKPIQLCRTDKETSHSE